MVTFERDKETGVIMAFKDGKKLGDVSVFGDQPLKDDAGEMEKNPHE